MISVILPTYNEKGNIVPLMQKLAQGLRPAGREFELVVVDDNSPDGTADAVREMQKDMREIRLIVRTNESGLASAVRRGIEEAKGDIIVLMDTDFNHDPFDVPKLVAGLSASDIVVGSRYIKGGEMEYSFLRHYLSLFFNLFVRAMLGLKTTDNLSGFMAVKKEIFETIDMDQVFQGFGEFHIPFIWMAHDRGYKISEIPVIYKDRTYGTSKFKPVENLINYTKTVLKVRAHARARHRKNAADQDKLSGMRGDRA